jgi:hypothetical protein
MADNTYNGDGGAWETDADWSLGHSPTASETVFFNGALGGTPPTGPIAPTTVAGVRATQGDGFGGIWPNLTVIGSVNLEDFGITIAAQSGGRIQLDNSSIIVTGTADSGAGSASGGGGGGIGIGM